MRREVPRQAAKRLEQQRQQQSKSAVRLKEDMKKIAALPLSKQRDDSCQKMFSVSLQDLQQQGLTKNGLPAVVWNAVEYLTQHGLTQEGLFRVNGNMKMVDQLRLKYDRGEEVELAKDADVCSVASLLKLFLRELPDGVITSALHPRFMQLYQDRDLLLLKDFLVDSGKGKFIAEYDPLIKLNTYRGPNIVYLTVCPDPDYTAYRNDAEKENNLKELLEELPDANYCLLKYLCRFLTQVAEHHPVNRMNIFNLATIFGPSCFHVPSGFEGMKEQEICNKIMAKMLENYNTLFELERTQKTDENHACEELARIILVKASCEQSLPISLTRALEREAPKSTPRSKITKSTREGSVHERLLPQPELSDGIPQVSLRLTDSSACLEEMDLPDEISFINRAAFFSRNRVREAYSVTKEERPPSAKVYNIKVGCFMCPDITLTESITLSTAQSSQEDERPMSPFYLSAHVSQVSSNIPATGEYLEKTIRSAVEQHLFDAHGSGGQSSEDSESGTSSASSNVSTRQRRRHHKEQDEGRRSRDVEVINKENIPSGFGNLEDCILTPQEVEKLQENNSGYIGERNKPKRQKSSTKLSELNENQDSPVGMESFSSSRPIARAGPDDMEVLSDESKENENDDVFFKHSQQISNMKIQEHPSIPDTKLQRNQDADGQEDSFVSEVPRLDLTALCDDNSWEEPVPAFSARERDGLAADEAHLSPQAGGLIRQLLDEDSDPMLSPRFYAYGQSQQYLDDTEVPPSPPNSHSFMRRRSSSLGSCEDDQEDLTPAQLTRRIQGLKKKIRKFEDRFEEERKYRPSHSDKAANPEVLKWTNELAKFRKQLKESKLKISEEDLAPVMRQRSNTLPKSFGSQLEKEDDKKQDLSDKSAKPAVEVTLDSIQKKLQEKRAETNRPEDIKDMTREDISAEKVALQKALLYYESIHGRPVTKNERQVMKPLYDRYRLVKQILSRANTIPVIGSPSSKRRSPLLQPIIEGETASFFKEIKEEEEGSDEDSVVKPDFTVTLKPDFSVRSFLDQLEDEADGFISPVDDKMPSKSSQDMGLSTLHAASMPELLEQLQEVREEKKQIRKKLREFEDNFFRENGRNVQKEDRTPMAEEYNEYKQIKAKLRLLEVLISKRDISSKIM